MSAILRPSTGRGNVAGTSPAAGDIGELIVGDRAFGSALALSNGVAASIASISLSPGDWDISGLVGFIPAPTTTVAMIEGSTSLVNNTAGGAQGEYVRNNWAPSNVPGTGAYPMVSLPPHQRLITVQTTVYLVAVAIFTTAALTAFGRIRARRMS